MCFTLIHVDGIKDRHAGGQTIVFSLITCWECSTSVGTKTCEIFSLTTFCTERFQTITGWSGLCLFVCLFASLSLCGFSNSDHLFLFLFKKKKFSRRFLSLVFKNICRVFYFFSRDTALSWPNSVTTSDNISGYWRPIWGLWAGSYLLIEILTTSKV